VQTRLALVILAVADVARAVRFYRAAFEWRVTVDVPVYVEFVLADGMRVGLYERAAFAANTGSVPHAVPRDALAPTELYLYADDLASAIERIEAAGARILSPLATRAWGDVAAYFADPDGNVIVLARPDTTTPER
jgi:predicted enzyme related to lactoylglutathione lyase